MTATSALDKYSQFRILLDLWREVGSWRENLPEKKTYNPIPYHKTDFYQCMPASLITVCSDDGMYDSQGSENRTTQAGDPWEGQKAI